MNGHALLSPSKASRWLACTPSARLEERFPETTGEYAREGSLCHALGELLINKHTGALKKAAFTKEFKVIEADPMFNDEMMECAENYASFVAERYAESLKHTEDAVLKVEAKLNLTDYIPEGFGTGDAVIIADGALEIIDLKYGKGVPVSCVNNNQMKVYALGAFREFDLLYDLHTVRMTIYQPRIDNISTWEMPSEDLMHWGETELKPKAQVAFAGGGEFAPGSHCRFCKAKAQCRALAEQQLEVAKYEFKSSELLTEEEIADVLSRSDAFTNWINAVSAFALTEAVEKGKKWPGFKLVEGRSNRVYMNPEAVAERLVKYGYEEDHIYTRALLGITAMEKAISKKSFEALLNDLVVKPRGKPTLVPETDKRAEIGGMESAKRDFGKSEENKET
jgi:hypothetical protein